MKVKELIAKLSSLDSELDILGYSEDASLLPPSYLFRLLDVVGVDIVEGEQTRGDNGIASLKIGHTSQSRKFAVIAVTCDM